MLKRLMRIINFIRRKFPYSEIIYLAYRDLRYWMFNRGKPVNCEIGGFNLTFELDPMDKGLSSELAIEKIHEPLSIQLLTEMVKPGWVIVDVGSHLGYFPVFEAKLVGPTGKVICLEPSVASYNILIRNIERNDVANIIVTYNMAASNKKERRKFYVNRLSNQSSFYTSSKARSVIEVDTQPLDEILQGEPRIDVIRMDIEGGEYEVIHGMIGSMKAYHPILFIELHPSPQRKPFLEIVHDLGYECQCIVDRRNNTSFLGGIWTSSKNIEYIQISNLVQMKESDAPFLVVLKPMAEKIGAIK